MRISVCIWIVLVCFLSIGALSEESSLEVYPEPAFEYVFGVVQVGESMVKEVVIMNKGEELLRGSAVVEIEETENEGEQDVEEEKDVFQIVSEANFVLASYEQFKLKIRFVPLKEKTYRAKLRIEASNNNKAELTLVGVGKKKQKMYYILGCGAYKCESSFCVRHNIFDLLFCAFVILGVILKSYNLRSLSIR